MSPTTRKCPAPRCTNTLIFAGYAGAVRAAGVAKVDQTQAAWLVEVLFFDVGMAAALQGRLFRRGTPEFGQALETIVFHELLASPTVTTSAMNRSATGGQPRVSRWIS